MRILLVGGAGYIGTHVALAFSKRGDTVGIYDNFSTGLKQNILRDSEVYEGDILDNEYLHEVISKGWDALIHLAALKAAGESMVNPEMFSLNNISGSVNLMTGCSLYDVKAFVLSSSAAVYGEPEYLPIDEDHPTRPENYYGYTKLSIEGHLDWYHRLKGICYASLRYFNAAGYDPHGLMTGLEKEPANLIPVVMEAAAGMREKVLVFGDDYNTPDGTGVRDYIHVTDLADAHVRAVDYLLAEQQSITVNLGSGHGLSVMEIINETRRVSGKEIPAEFTGRRPGDPAKLVASSKRAKQLLGWCAQHSDLESIIKTTWQIYRKTT